MSSVFFVFTLIHAISGLLALLICFGFLPSRVFVAFVDLGSETMTNIRYCRRGDPPYRHPVGVAILELRSLRPVGGLNRVEVLSSRRLSESAPCGCHDLGVKKSVPCGRTYSSRSFVIEATLRVDRYPVGIFRLRSYEVLTLWVDLTESNFVVEATLRVDRYPVGIFRLRR